MTKEQIKRFVKKVAGENIRIYYYGSTRHDYYWFPAYVNLCNRSIHLNTRDLLTDNMTKGEVWYKNVLMHEIGHIKSRYSHSKIERELRAQLWAISKAYKLGMKKIARIGRLYLTKKWTMNYYGKKYGWNSNSRVYILANKLAKKRGII